MAATGFPSQSFAALATHDFLTHSGHIPLMVLILEALLARPGYFLRLDPYLLLLAGILQAGVTQWLAGRGVQRPVLTNLVGALVYSLLELLAEGGGFFMQWHHQAYWGFAIGFASLQALQRLAALRNFFVLLESILRACIPLVLYALFEVRSDSAGLSLEEFWDDQAHRYLTIVLLLLGMLLGFAEVNLRRSLAQIQALTERLREYSGWALGSGILDRAIEDAKTLSLKRVDRAIVFMDIRGFTAWSEQQTPEAVVTMLNSFYANAEAALGNIAPIKLKYTADEVMVVFATAQEAAVAATKMLAGAQTLLRSTGLAAGAGLHMGPVVEGVLGGSGAKAYDFIGDTVNTAQRLCDAASPGELLVSLAAAQAAGHQSASIREITVKGKREPLLATCVTV